MIELTHEEALAEIERLQGIIAGFYDAVAHGDSCHRAWLKEEVDSYLGKFRIVLEKSA